MTRRRRCEELPATWPPASTCSLLSPATKQGHVFPSHSAVRSSLFTELCCQGHAAAAAGVRDRDGAALCVAEAGGVPRAAAARPPGHRQPPPHRLDHPRTQTQLSRWTQSSCQALVLLSLRTETKQKYVYRLGLDNKKYLCRPGQRGDSNQRHSYLRHRPRDGQPRGLHHHGLRPGSQPRASRGQGGQWGTSFYRCKTTMLR